MAAAADVHPLRINWRGVLAAITTSFDANPGVDFEAVAEQARSMATADCVGVVPGWVYGEGAALSADERVALAACCVEAVGDVLAVVPMVSAREMADLGARMAAVGVTGVLVQPDDCDLQAAMRATELPCALIATGNLEPGTLADLAATVPQLEAVLDLSHDPRSVAAIAGAVGDRLEVLTSDEAVPAGLTAGAAGWISGVAAAWPGETVALYDAVIAGERRKTRELRDWLAPFLALDVEANAVQMIKLVQAILATRNERVRPPLVALEDAERAAAAEMIERALATRPVLDADLLA